MPGGLGGFVYARVLMEGIWCRPGFDGGWGGFFGVGGKPVVDGG